MQSSSDDRKVELDNPPYARQHSLAGLAILLSFLGLLLLVYCYGGFGSFRLSPGLVLTFIIGLIAIVAGIVVLWQAVQKSRAYWAIPVVLLFSFASFCAAFMVVTEVRHQRYHARPTCMPSLNSLGYAMLMYAEEYDSKLPLADTWCDAISPYVSDEKSFVCPELPDARCGYTLNSRIAGVNVDSLPNASYVAMLFDGRGGWNLAGGRSDVVFRHNGDANIIFGDCHAKGYTRQDISTVTWSPPAQ